MGLPREETVRCWRCSIGRTHYDLILHLRPCREPDGVDSTFSEFLSQRNSDCLIPEVSVSVVASHNNPSQFGLLSGHITTVEALGFLYLHLLDLPESFGTFSPVLADLSLR